MWMSETPALQASMMIWLASLTMALSFSSTIAAVDSSCFSDSASLTSSPMISAMEPFALSESASPVAAYTNCRMSLRRPTANWMLRPGKIRLMSWTRSKLLGSSIRICTPSLSRRRGIQKFFFR